MVKSIGGIYSKNKDGDKTVFFRIRTDADGYRGKVEISIGPTKLPVLDADLDGDDSFPFSAKHQESKLLVVKVAAGEVSNSVLLDLDAPSDP